MTEVRKSRTEAIMAALPSASGYGALKGGFEGAPRPSLFDQLLFEALSEPAGEAGAQHLTGEPSQCRREATLG